MTKDNKIFKYTQIYDYLKNIKFDEYISDRRTNIHNQLFNNAIKLLIEDVNSNIPVSNISQKLKDIIDKYNDIQEQYQKEKLKPFNKDNFKFIEIKNKSWYKPSKVNIIYSFSPVINKLGHYTKLTLGTFSLDELWKNEYIFKKNIENVLSFNNSNASFSIEYIDYIKGICVLYDKVSFKTQTIDLDYILDINDYEFLENYNQMFIVKRKNNNE